MGAFGMEAMSYSLTAATAYLGLACGIIAAYMAREEIRAGAKYFAVLQAAITALILFLAMAFFKVNLLLNIAFIALFFGIIRQLEFPQSYIMYPAFAAALYISRVRAGTFATIASLIFLYGLPTAALLIDFKRKNYFKILLYHLTFIVIALSAMAIS